MKIDINEMIEKMSPDAFFKYMMLAGVNITSMHMNRMNRGTSYSGGYKTYTTYPKWNIAAALWLYAIAYDNNKYIHMHEVYPFMLRENDPEDSRTVLHSPAVGRTTINFDTFKEVMREVYGEEAGESIINLVRSLNKQIQEENEENK